MTDSAAEYEFMGERIPEHMCEGLRLYLEMHVKPGDFLMAVLSNDLREACTRADHINIRLLHVYVAYLWNHASAYAWGNAERVEAWLAAQPPD